MWFMRHVATEILNRVAQGNHEPHQISWFQQQQPSCQPLLLVVRTFYTFYPTRHLPPHEIADT